LREGEIGGMAAGRDMTAAVPSGGV
jgi:hypothetical protein